MPSLYLVTMPPSHFCEKARWALDLLGQQVVEDCCAPPFHRGVLKKIGAGPTVPALMVNNRDLKRESGDILRFVDAQLPIESRLFPPDAVQGPLVQDFCNRCDKELAPHSPRMLFAYLNTAQYVQLLTAGVPDEQAKKFKMIAPVLRLVHRFQKKLTPAGFEESVRKVDQFNQKVDQLLDDGRKYLFCDRFTAADLTFCSLVAPAMLIREFGGAMLPLDEAPQPLRTEVDRLRKTRVGTYVQAVYKSFRKLKLL